MNSCCESARAWAPLLLRLPIGATFILAGWGKLTAPGGPAGVMLKGLGPEGINLPAPELMAWLAALGELIGGVSMLVGGLTWVGGVLIVVIMLFAIFGFHFKNGFMGPGGWAWQATLLMSGAFFILNGPGSISVDAWLFKKKTDVPPK